MDVTITLPDDRTATGECMAVVSGRSSPAPLGDPHDGYAPHNHFTGRAFMSLWHLDEYWSSPEGLERRGTLYPVGDDPSGDVHPVIEIATVEVDQIIPDLHVADEEWAWTLDAVGGDLMEAGIRMEELIADDDGPLRTPAYTGALYYVRRVDTHAGARGQEVALYLIAHTLSTLGTSVSDLAMIHARPDPAQWVNGQAERVSADRLASHYEKLGFQRSGRRSENCILLELSFGAVQCPLPYWWDGYPAAER